MEFILYGLFFITGVLVHSAYTYVLGLGTLGVTTRQSIDDSLLVIGSTYEKIISMNETMYKGMVEKGVDEKEVDIHRRMDKAELEALMNIVVINLKSVVPKRLQGFANFSDWRTAEKEITKIIKFRMKLDK
jgi:hypothetical protein